MILGTHNSATGGSLVWWQKPLAWVINPTSKCQDRSIADQLADGVKVFNLQIARVKGKWRFSHGLALYKEDVWETLKLMRLCASVKEPIYFQLYLDKCFWCKQDVEEFEWLISQIKKELSTSWFVMLSARVEGTEYYPHRHTGKYPSLEEHYWTKGWVKCTKPKNYFEHLPLPKWHAKKYNKAYKENCKKEYLMLDYYNYG